MNCVEKVAHQDDTDGADGHKQGQQAGLDGLAQHDHGGQRQGGDRHHKAEDGTQLRAFGKQSFSHRNGTEDVRVHGNTHQNRQDHAEGVAAAQNGFHPGLGNPVVNDGANAHAHQNVGENLLEGAQHLLLGIGQAVFAGQGGGLNVHAACLEDKVLHMAFHVQRLDQAAARHRNDQTHDHIGHSHLGAEDAGKQNQAAQVHHGGGNQEGEGNSQGQARTGEAHEQGDGGAGAEGGDGAQKSGNAVGSQAVETTDDFFAALGREVALNVGDKEDQRTQQDGDLNHIVQKELQAAAQPGGGVQPKRAEKGADGAVQPFHAQDLVLEKGPDHWQHPALHSQFLPRPPRKACSASRVSRFRE